MRESITRAEVLEVVTEEYKNQFSVIFWDVSKCLEMVFSIFIKKKEPTSNSSALVNSLTFSHEDILSGD